MTLFIQDVELSSSVILVGAICGMRTALYILMEWAERIGWIGKLRGWNIRWKEMANRMAP